MTELKATPGPWRLSLTDSTLVINDDMEIAEMCGDYDSDNEWPLMEANAHLIAAAPELYEALEAVEPFLSVWLARFPKNDGYSLNTNEPDEGHFNRDNARQMLAALKKARGE